jgi:hypothetical protein
MLNCHVKKEAPKSVKARLDDKKIIERIDSAKNAPNYLTLVLRAHHGLDELINRGFELFTGMPTNNLARQPFAAKLDIAETLRLIPKSSVPLFRSFNTIRNRFAHNPFASFTAKDARDMANLLSPVQRAVITWENKDKVSELSKRDFLLRCILAMEAELVVEIKSKVSHDVEWGILMNQTIEVAKGLKPDPNSNSKVKLKKEVEAKVKEILKFI